MSEPVLELDTKEWDDLLEKMVSNLKRAQALLKTAALAYGFADIIDHFSEERGPDGGWTPRSPITQFRYAMIQSGQWRPPKGMRQGSFRPSNKLLQLTGAMRMEMLPKAGAAHIALEGGDAVRLFNNAAYSGRQNDGGGGIPARPFMWLSEEAQDKMLDTIAKIIMEDQQEGL
jgi:hypothetical protein